MKNLKMKQLIHYKKIAVLLLYIVAFGISAMVITSCEEEIPEAGSIQDETPPTAGFSYSASSESNLAINFSNLSSSATQYVWDFGDGNTSTEKEPTNTYADFGTYTVTLTSSDNLGVTSTITDDVLVVAGPFQPVVSESGFEDNSARAAGCGDGLDGRDCWRNSDLGGVIQITSSPVRSGDQAAKLTGVSTDKRIGYQLITVEADQNYDLNFYYTMLNDKVGFITVSVLSGPVSSHEEALTNTIGSITVNDQTDPDAYIGATVSFNSGSSKEIAIYFFNEGSVEARLDDFSIDIGQEGAVPPSASFSFEQSETDFLEYNFTNSSINAESYLWDFGDGNTSTDESPTHTYASAAVYTVTLSATNGVGTTVDFSSPIDIQAPVTAGFSFEVDATDYKTYSFTDTSEDAVSLLWEFGDGFQFTGMNPTHTYDEDGIYTVTLTATSITGLEDKATADITVAQGLIASINNPGFDDEPVRNDNLNAWGRGSMLEESLKALKGGGTWTAQSTTSERTGTYGAKLPTYQSESSGDDDELNRRRFIYQAIAVAPNTEYTISWYMRNKDSDAGTAVTVDIYNAPFTDASLVDSPGDRIIATQVYDAASGHDTNSYTLASITFNSGSSSEVFLFIQNDYTLDGTDDQESETFFDDFEITDN